VNVPVKKYDSAESAMAAISEIGQRTTTVPLVDDSHEFKVTLRSLGAQDETDSFVDCMNFWGQAFLYKHKIETLVRCITHVNDQPIDSLSLDQRRKLIGQWGQSLVDKLFLEYAALIGAVDDFLEKVKLTAQTNVVGFRDAAEQAEKEKAKLEDSNEEIKDESEK
jgi:hypothetical protein